MIQQHETVTATGDVDRARRWALIGIIAGQAVVYLVVAILSRRFEYEAPFQQRPIVLFLGLMAVSFALHLWGLRIALAMSSIRDVGICIWLGAVLFRLLLLPSVPIQEVDIYRYIWDGAVVASGNNPYQYSPQQIAQQPSTAAAFSPSLASLVHLRDHSRSARLALSRIHFGELITVYPPVLRPFLVLPRS